MIFSEHLRYLRKQNNMTQEELGKLLHLSINAISNYETGKQEPSLSTLIKISKIFNMSVDELLLPTKNK